MLNLPIESIARIAEARRHAEKELRRALETLDSNSPSVYFPAWGAFSTALFDAEAAELQGVASLEEDLRTAAFEALSEVVEAILPDRGLSRVPRPRTDEEKHLLIESEQEFDDDGLLLELLEPGGMRPLALEGAMGVYAQHGDWEHFMPEGIRFHLRWPDNNRTLRVILRQKLEKRIPYWIDRFHSGWRDRRTFNSPDASEPEAANSNSSRRVQETTEAGIESRHSATVRGERSTDDSEATKTSNKRFPSSVMSVIAVKRLEAYMESHGGQTAFASMVPTTDRTIRSFRRTGKVRRDIFEAVAIAMGTTTDELLKE